MSVGQLLINIATVGFFVSMALNIVSMTYSRRGNTAKSGKLIRGSLDVILVSFLIFFTGLFLVFQT